MEPEYLCVHSRQVLAGPQFDKVDPVVTGRELGHLFLILRLSEESSYLAQVHHEELGVGFLVEEELFLCLDPSTGICVIALSTPLMKHSLLMNVRKEG